MASGCCPPKCSSTGSRSQLRTRRRRPRRALVHRREGGSAGRHVGGDVAEARTKVGRPDETFHDLPPHGKRWLLRRARARKELMAHATDTRRRESVRYTSTRRVTATPPSADAHRHDRKRHGCAIGRHRAVDGRRRKPLTRPFRKRVGRESNPEFSAWEAVLCSETTHAWSGDSYFGRDESISRQFPAKPRRATSQDER